MATHSSSDVIQVSKPRDPKMIWEDVIFTLFGGKIFTVEFRTWVFSVCWLQWRFQHIKGVNNVFLCSFLRFKTSPFLLQLFRRMLQRCFAVKLLKCFADEEPSPSFPSLWGWIVNDRIFGWTVSSTSIYPKVHLPLSVLQIMLPIKYVI